MKRKFQLRGFVLGVLVSVLVLSVVSPALAALSSKWIEVYTGVNVYVDDQLVQPKDVNGNPVEVFVYNGTTYLPIRAIGNALGKTVQWDGKTNSAYVGKHSSNKPAVWIEDLNWFSGSGNYHIIDNPKDNMGQSYSHAVCFSDTKYFRDTEIDKTYLINGQYSAISGTLFQTYEGRDFTDKTNYITTGTLKIYGDGELLYSGEMYGGKKPEDFYIDLTGVLELRIYGMCNENGYYGYAYNGVANFGLWT